MHTPSGPSRHSAMAKNIYHRRLVADSSAKACWICYKPSATVLITPDNDDWFHICAGHLTDRKFAISQDAEDLEKKKREEAIEREIEEVKKEYLEKIAKKAEKRKGKDKEKAKAEKKEEKKEDEADEKAKEDKVKALEKKQEDETAKVEGPRIFELQKHFWGMRMQKKRDLEVAKKNRERLRNGALFPAVPGGPPGG
nr:hypothetical protein B0A51_04117 [Rachicladosporium sp. CCFEE 5018]